ncbi:hypothetical protein GCM10009788_45650 [Nocardioides humi]|uniref:Uncharacterized protein n=1 Tax=Nocardioides humi TaxID=449461 RepID=A0ABN2BBS3_9ACTN
MEDHLDPAGEAAEGLVDAVVDDLPEAVHQPPGVGGADVHPGTLPHGLEALEDQEVGCVVGVVGDDRLLTGGSRWIGGTSKDMNLPATRRASAQGHGARMVTVLFRAVGNHRKDGSQVLG